MSQDNVSMSLAVEFGCWLVEIVKGSFIVKQSNNEVTLRQVCRQQKSKGILTNALASVLTFGSGKQVADFYL